MIAFRPRSVKARACRGLFLSPARFKGRECTIGIAPLAAPVDAPRAARGARSDKATLKAKRERRRVNTKRPECPSGRSRDRGESGAADSLDHPTRAAAVSSTIGRYVGLGLDTWGTRLRPCPVFRPSPRHRDCVSSLARHSHRQIDRWNESWEFLVLASHFGPRAQGTFSVRRAAANQARFGDRCERWRRRCSASTRDPHSEGQ